MVVSPFDIWLLVLLVLVLLSSDHFEPFSFELQLPNPHLVTKDKRLAQGLPPGSGDKSVAET